MQSFVVITVRCIVLSHPMVKGARYICVTYLYVRFVYSARSMCLFVLHVKGGVCLEKLNIELKR